MIGPVSRILGRVFAGILIGAGFVSDAHVMGLDADLAELIGWALWGCTEAAYAIAKRKGWAT